MQITEFERPLPKESPSTGPPHRSSSLAACAGFCGAIPLGLALWCPLVMLASDASPLGHWNVRSLLWLLTSALAFIPLQVSLAFVDRRDWPRTLGVIFGGLCVGAASALLFLFALFLILPAAALGLVFGLVKFLPCWWKGDAAGRALSLLGMTPTALYFVSRIAEESVHTGPDHSLLGMILTADQEPYLLASLLLLIHLLMIAWVILRIQSRAR